MANEVTYTEARARFAQLWDRIIDSRETLIIHRRGQEDIAMLPADELAGLLETAHLLRSPRNAERLLTALARARSEDGKPESVETLARDLGLDVVR